MRHPFSPAAKGFSRALILAIVLLSVYLVATRLRPAPSALPSQKWTLEQQAIGARLSSLPPSTTVPFLLAVDAAQPSAEAYLARTLASLRAADHMAATPVLVLFDPTAPFAHKVAALVAAIDFAPALALATPPRAEPSRAAFQLLKFGLGLPFRGVVWLPIGLQVSQDARDFAAWALEQLERDGTLRGLWGVNLYYSRGQGFGGSERYTLATEEGGLSPWGAVLPRAALPLVRQAYAAAGAAWLPALGEAVKAQGLRVATPRISRSRPIRELADLAQGGEAMYIPVSVPKGLLALAPDAVLLQPQPLALFTNGPSNTTLSLLLAQDHSLDYSGRTFLLVPHH
jgi:hypothetical protein